MIYIISFLLGAACGLVITEIAKNVRPRTRTNAPNSTPPTKYIFTDPPPVIIRTRLIQPEPVTIQVRTEPAPSYRELAEKIIKEFPVIGPSALARIIGCSKSTAYTLIKEITQI